MFFSKRKMNFEPYVSQREQEVSDEELEQSTPVENEPEVTVAAEVNTSTVQEAAAVNQVAEQEAAGPVVNEYVEPVAQESYQAVEEAAIVEEPSPYAEAAAAESFYFSGYMEPEPKGEENEADTPSLEIPKVEDKFAKEREQMEYEVIIGKNTSFKGEINIDGATRIDGRVEGTVCVNNDLFVGETGHIEGEIKVINATISGTIVGNIKCSSRLELLATSSISGDIECGALIVAEGASINATVACGKAVAGNEPTPAEAAPVVE